MKDITRIHLAKVPYNIELDAKKQLQDYLRSLESYSVEAEVLEDIEIRMTELLSERGIKPEDVIGTSDIEAIRHQLGEPKDFADEDMAAGMEVVDQSGRSLYRDIDGAIVGGVLAGVAKYLRINVMWVRLLFIVAALFSFGLFLVIYIITWLVIPPARTAAEKLQLAGKPVTLGSIRSLNELGETSGEKRAMVVRRVMTLLAGFACVIGVIGSVSLLIAAIISIPQLERGGYHPDFRVPLYLAIMSGVLLIALFLLGAFASFAQKINKRIIIAASIIIVLGMTTFGTAVGTGIYQERQAYELAERNKLETRIALPVAMNSISTLKVNVPDGVSVVYQVTDDDEPSARQTGIKGNPVASISVTGQSAELDLKELKHLPYGPIESILIKGPKLTTLEATKGSLAYEGMDRQDLTVNAKGQSSISLADSEIGTLVAELSDQSHLETTAAAVSNVDARLKDESAASLGTIDTLNVATPGVCGVDKKVSITLRGINESKYRLNGKEIGITQDTNESSSRQACFELELTDYNSYND